MLRQHKTMWLSVICTRKPTCKQLLRIMTTVRFHILNIWLTRVNAVTAEEAAALEKATRGQTKSSLWHAARKWRLTASNFGRITKCFGSRSRERLCCHLANPPELRHKAVLHGTKYEAVAIRKFEEIKGIKVEPCGIFVRPDYSYLGASPDSIVDDASILEVKCPYSGRDDKIEPGSKFSFLERNEAGLLTVKRNHNYYSQIQGQLFLSLRQMAYLMVYTFVDTAVIDVPFDSDFCNDSMIPSLTLFYQKYYRKHLASLL